ncbi:MAG: IS256 family transposase, partial [Legionellales bacterium]
ELEIPRDRNGSFDPQFVKKRQNRLTGLNDQILSLYTKGMTTRDIESHLQEIYGSDVSRILISKVTDSILEEVTA